MMHWGEFQNTAERLAQGRTEGDWRSAISRRLDIGRGGESHFNLFTGLGNCGFPAVAVIAGQIDTLRRRRVRADYDLLHPIGQGFALARVQEARAMVADFQVLLKTILPAHIADGARRHLQAIGWLGRAP